MRIRHWIAWGLLVFVILGVGGVAFGFHAAGYEKYVVETGSMVPALDPGDLVVDRPVNGDLKVGDIITFKHGQGDDLVTHRIVGITPEGIKTKGDANRTADVWTIPDDYVQGVVAFRIPKGGYVITFMSKPAGIGAVTAALTALILLWRVFFPSEENSQGSSEGPTTTAENAPRDETSETDFDRLSAGLPPQPPAAGDIFPLGGRHAR